MAARATRRQSPAWPPGLNTAVSRNHARSLSLAIPPSGRRALPTRLRSPMFHLLPPSWHSHPLSVIRAPESSRSRGKYLPGTRLSGRSSFARRPGPARRHRTPKPNLLPSSILEDLGHLGNKKGQPRPYPVLAVLHSATVALRIGQPAGRPTHGWGLAWSIAAIQEASPDADSPANRRFRRRMKSPHTARRSAQRIPAQILTRISHHSVPLLDVRQAVLRGSAPHCFCEAVAHCDPTWGVGEKCGLRLLARPVG